MKKNMGNADRIIRVIIALVAAGLYFGGVLEGTVGLVALVMAIIFLLTSLISFCPIYRIFGMSTCPAEKS